MKSYLGEFEELVMLAIARLGPDQAYGVPIREMIERQAARAVSTGALYTTFERLEERGYISSRKGESTPQRGGRPKMYFKIEAPGLAALTRAEQARLSIKGNEALPKGLILRGS